MSVKTKQLSGICLKPAVAPGGQRLVWLPSGALTLLLVSVVLLYKRLSNGLALAWNSLTTRWTAVTGQILLDMPTNAGNEGDIWLFAAFFALFLILILWMLCRKHSGIAAAILLATAFFVGMFAPGWCWLPALGAAAFTAWRQPALGKGRVKRLAMCVIACVLMAALVFWLLPNGLDLTGLREQMKDSMHRHRYEPAGAVLPEGDSLAAPVQSDAILLEVTMEQPEELYLRGFVGEIYDGSRWSPVSYEQLSDASDLVYWLQQSGFYPQTQFAQAVQACSLPENINRITVTNLAACSKYLYVPYQLATIEMGGTLPQNKLQLAAIDANGSRSYTFTTIHQAEQSMQPLLEQLQAGKSPLEAFLSAEGSYRNLMTVLSPESAAEILETLQPALDALCATYGGRTELTPEQAELCAMQFAEGYQDDNLYSKATATVLALRYFGIPARYAEGWHISLGMAQEAEGQPVKVTSRQAAAWAEVYQDGIGWMPLVLTPGYRTLSGVLSEDGLQVGGSSGSSSLPEEIPQAEELEELHQPPQEDLGEVLQEQPQTQQLLKWLQILLVSVGLLLLLCVLILLVRHRVILRRRMALFRTEDAAQAIGWLYLDTALLLERLGIYRNGGSMATVCCAAEERFGADYAARCRAVTALNGEALFSTHPMSEEHRNAAVSFREETLSLLKNNSRWHRRLWLKWIQCVY